MGDNVERHGISASEIPQSMTYTQNSNFKLIIIQQGEETILQSKNSMSQKRMQVLEATGREGGREGGGER